MLAEHSYLCSIEITILKMMHSKVWSKLVTLDKKYYPEDYYASTLILLALEKELLNKELKLLEGY